MKILLPILALLQISSTHASLVGIMDSGTDMSHKNLREKAWINQKEKVGNKDLDGDGLPGDVRGYDFTANKAEPFDPQYNNLITNDVKTFFNYYAKYETRTINETELQWLKTHSEDEKLMNDVNFIGGYIHGTHVAGISSVGVHGAKILPMKIIPTVYKAATVKPSSNFSNKTESLILNAIAPIMSVEEFKNEILKDASGQIEEMVGIHKVLNFHRVDVVNQSFGIGWNDAKNFITAGFIESLNREPTESELEYLTKSYFDKLIKDGSRMFSAAPNTIFCIAAGNDASDNDAHPDYPSSINAENRIVVAATNGYNELADFSNFGAKRVDVAAPGVAINSTAPMDNFIQLSGTSQATPFVTNTIARVKDLNQKLKVRDITQIIYGTVDVKAWLKGKVVTSGIVNKLRAFRAAELSRTMSVSNAIAQARVEVADVPTIKSFGAESFLPSILKFKPIRPSLLIRK